MVESPSRLAGTQKASSSNPPGVQIYFESKPISNFNNLLEKGKHDEFDEHDNDDES